MAVSMNPRPVVYSDSATLKGRHFTVESLIVMSGASKTLTLPTPTKDLAGKPTFFIHNGTGTLTLSGAFPTGSSYVMDTKSTAIVECLPVTSSSYKWHAISSGGIAAGLTEGIQDIIGAMFTTTNTEAGCTVTYQDSTGDIDVSVDLKTNGGLVLESNAIAVDLAASAITGTLAVGDGGTGASTLTDHGVLLGSGTGAVTPMSVLTNGQLIIGVSGADPSTQACSATPGAATVPISDGSNHLDGWISAATAATPGLVEHQNWSDYVPTWVFGTADPTGSVVKVGRYMHVGNMVTFYCSFEATDGNDGTLTSVTLPVAPTDSNTLIPLRGQQKVNATWTDCLAFIDATTSLNIQVHTATACTDAAACAYYISGSYEVSAT